MNERKTVHKHEYIDLDGGIDSAIKKLIAVKLELKARGAQDIYIDICTYDDYVKTRIDWTELESEEELEKRIISEEKEREKLKKELKLKKEKQWAREEKIYLKLKKKFESSK